MVNILDVFPTLGEAPTASPSSWADVVSRRAETFKGFCQREAEKGFIRPGTSLESPQGQEMIRLLMFRVLEEYTEALAAVEIEHMLEELIDAFNYLLSALLLEAPDDPQVQRLLAEQLQITFDEAQEERPAIYNLVSDRFLPQTKELGECTIMLAEVTDRFRNRAWMNNPQDLYFTGRGLFRRAALDAAKSIFMAFKSWEEFWHYYVGKDEVLKFRLRSNY